MTHPSEDFNPTIGPPTHLHAAVNVGFTTDALTSKEMITLLELFGEEQFKARLAELLADIGLVSNKEQVAYAVLTWMAVATPERN